MILSNKETCISVAKVSELLNVTERYIQNKIKKNEFKFIETTSFFGGGKSGKSYKIALSSLPAKAQLKYLQEYYSDENQKDFSFGFDIALYKEKYGEKGLKEFLLKHTVTREAIRIQDAREKNMTKELNALANENDVALKTLYRWIEAYKQSGPAGLAKKIDRSDKGARRSLCLASMDYVAGKYLRKEALPKKSTVFEMLQERVFECGEDYCYRCIHNAGTEERAMALVKLPSLEECDKPTKNGMIATKSYASLARIIDEDIPKAVEILARQGKKAWEAEQMVKATRQKPELVNEVWFGDHHVFDLFVIDDKGKAVRPWLTVWYDITSGCPVGYCLNTNPNAWTIAEAFVNAVKQKKSFPFYGLPSSVYIDNGKDYRSHLFDGTSIIENRIGKIDYNIETKGMMAQLNVETHFATPYYAWVKPIERWFKTVEEKYIRELPGWCGNCPENRYDGFEKDLKKLITSGKLLTLDELHEILQNEILPRYIERPHGGYNNEIPLERYNRLKKARCDQPSEAMLMIAKMETDERKVSPAGIRWNNEIYWNDELRHYVGEWVTIKYNRYDKDELVIMANNRFVCVAEPHERFSYINEDPDKIAEHIALQKRQYRETREKLAYITADPQWMPRKSSEKAHVIEFADKQPANTTAVDYEKANSGIKTAKERKKRTAKSDSENMFRKRYKEIGTALLDEDSHNE